MDKNKKIELLTKYYTFSKKYMPLITLLLLVVMSFCKISTAITLGVYFGLLIAHLICVALLKKQLQKNVVDLIKENGGA